MSVCVRVCVHNHIYFAVKCDSDLIVLIFQLLKYIVYYLVN